MDITIDTTYYSVEDTVLELFTGSNCSDLITLSCNDDDDEGEDPLLSSVTFDTTNYLNTILLFRIGSYSSGNGQGTGTFEISGPVINSGKNLIIT